MTASQESQLTFDRFSFDPRTLELRADGSIVALQQQPARVLALLLARPGELVTRDELRKAVWGEDTFVDFNRSLNFCVSQIRAALGDDPDAPRYVETLRGRGYRFIGGSSVPQAPSVAWVPQAPRVPQVPQVPQVPRGLAGRWAWIGLAASLVITPVVWMAASSGRQDPRVAIASFDASTGSEEWSRTLRAQIVTHLAHGGTRIVEAGAARPGGSGSWYLDARVDRSPEQYRVTVLLHDPTGAVRFTDIFDGPPGDWIEAQNEMARIITQAVRYNIEGPDKAGGIERRVPRRKIPFS